MDTLANTIAAEVKSRCAEEFKEVTEWIDDELSIIGTRMARLVRDSRGKEYTAEFRGGLADVLTRRIRIAAEEHGVTNLRSRPRKVAVRVADYVAGMEAAASGAGEAPTP